MRRRSRLVGLVGVAVGTAPGRRRDRRQVDLRAVLPQALERVVLALLLVLDVDDDVAEVDEDPAALALALAADRLADQLTQPVLDLVDDGAALPLGRCGGDDEHVGERHLLAHVDGHHLLGELLLGGQGGHLRELDRMVCCGHESPRGGADDRCVGTVPALARSAAYRRYLLMYWTTPSGTRYQTGAPSATRARQSVELIAMAGTSCSVTRSSGSPLSDSSWPGRVTPMKWASSKRCSASFQDRISARASAPVMKNSSSSGRSVLMSRRVSIVNVGPGRSMSTLLTVKRGLEAVAMTVMR